MTAVGPADSGTTPDRWIYGLRVRSVIDLPDWSPAVGGEPDVFIRQGVIPGPDPEGPPYTARFDVEAGELRLRVVAVGRYSATGGSLIQVDPFPDAKAEDLRLYLTGAMMGAILHQRGIYPLHASCVALPGTAGGVAFAGRSGAGKSTLVATMVGRGAAFVSDDICVMPPTGPAGLQVWPGAARVKLDETGLGVVPGTVSELDPAGGDRGKFHLPMASSLSHASPVALDRVYILTDGEGPPRVERLAGLDAVSALMEETYFLAAARALGLTAQVFRLAGRVAQALPISRLVRPRGLEHLPAVAAVIERDAREPEG